ncbi:hypothetical protein ACP4OV_011062 [Aristida adscensionis]
MGLCGERSRPAAARDRARVGAERCAAWGSTASKAGRRRRGMWRRVVRRRALRRAKPARAAARPRLWRALPGGDGGQGHSGSGQGWLHRIWHQICDEFASLDTKKLHQRWPSFKYTAAASSLQQIEPVLWTREDDKSYN